MLQQSHTMTIGQLSRRTGVSIKVLRTYEDLGFLYTWGRSEGNYRLFGEETEWCVQVVQGLRSLGLTLKEIQALVARSAERPGEPINAQLEASLAQVLARVEERLTTLQTLRQRILDFQAACTGEPAQPTVAALMQLFARDPHHNALCSLS
jgi:MerR family copper efflux transcriptional regulator